MLSILPFIKYQYIFINKLIKQYTPNTNDPNKFKNSNLKLILYVVKVYLNKFGSLLKVDLS